MTPLGDAVCFINNETGQLPLCMYYLKAALKGYGQGVFRSYVEQANIGVTWDRKLSAIWPILRLIRVIPQQRSLITVERTVEEVVEFKVATGI